MQEDQRIELLDNIAAAGIKGDLLHLLSLSEQLKEISVSQDENPEELRALQEAARRAASLLGAAQEGVASTRALLEDLLGQGQVSGYDPSGKMQKHVTPSRLARHRF